MSILSEGKGVMKWLKQKGNTEQFSRYLLKVFNEQTDITFYRIRRGNEVSDNSRFQTFVSWYNKQDIKSIVEEWKTYREEKKQMKQSELNKYFDSDLHKYIIQNQSIARNQLYKVFKNTMSFTSFSKAYNKSKTKFNETT